VPRINRNRLHILIGAICGGVAIFYGASLWGSAYPIFANSFIRDRQIQAIERQSGKSYFEWEQEQALRCAKEAEDPNNSNTGVFGLVPQPKHHFYRLCMNPAIVPVDDSEIVGAFLKKNAHWIVAYILASVAMAWSVGFAIAKALPKGTVGFWRWLTTEEKLP
jgi:hypothetical protein